MSSESLVVLAAEIQKISSQSGNIDMDHARTLFTDLRAGLSEGIIRAAEPDPSSATGWKVNSWVKQGILLGFRSGKLSPYSAPNPEAPFFDKDTLPLKSFDPKANVRLVPGGSAIRDGSYIGTGVICMPPMYVNIGSYVGDDTLIDSHALVGSCAQVGYRVHISAAAQIGGVLEPVGALPVIVEDDVLIGGNTGIYEGIIVRKRAVIAAGTILTGSTPIYDLVRKEIIKSSTDTPTIIPEGAVVVPGARAITATPGKDWGLSLTTPVIVKYRDNKTDTRTELEQWIR